MQRFDMPESNQPIREKLSYRAFVMGHKDELSIDGKTFYWPHREADSTSKKGGKQ
jgi:hypothetical protein